MWNHFAITLWRFSFAPHITANHLLEYAISLVLAKTNDSFHDEEAMLPSKRYIPGAARWMCVCVCVVAVKFCSGSVVFSTYVTWDEEFTYGAGKSNIYRNYVYVCQSLRRLCKHKGDDEDDPQNFIVCTNTFKKYWETQHRQDVVMVFGIYAVAARIHMRRHWNTK